MKCLLSLFIVTQFFRYGQGYKAAILEHSPVAGATPTETVQKNLEIYRSFVTRARCEGADIIVFPEYGLTTLVDVPDEYAIDLSKDNRVLQELSAIAVENSIYLVVNLLEQVTDTTKIKYYNVNLIYNRNGTIIAKYRKINLFNEPNLASGNEIVTFKTDFGVTFGVFTCQDILYYHPSRTILANTEITDIVYPVAWFSTMPFYTALTVQHGYFTTNRVNFLATNYNQPKEGHGGSGIYVANARVANIYINDTIGSTLLIQDIAQQKKRHSTGRRCVSKTDLRPSVLTTPTNMTNFLTYTDFIAADYVFQDVDLSQKRTTSDICYGQFCCNFKINVERPNLEETYKLMAYDGRVIFDRSYVYIRVCSLLACKNSTKESCGGRIDGTTEFGRIAVEARMKKDNATFYTPLTLNSGLQPILDTTYCDSTTSSTSNLKLDTNSAVKGVLVFGLFGKNDSLIL